MVAPADPRHELEHRHRLQGKVGAGAEGGHRPAQPAARAQVGDEADEVSPVGVEEAEKGRIALAAGPPRVVADGLERDHQADVVAPLARRLGVDHAAHLAPVEERRLLVDEGHEAQAVPRAGARQPPRKLEQGGHAAGVVVGPGTAQHRVVMRPDQQDLSAVAAPRRRDLEIARLHPFHPVGQRRHRVSLAPPLRLDVAGRLLQGPRPEDVALADRLGQRDDVRTELLGRDLHHRFGSRRRRRLAAGAHRQGQGREQPPTRRG